MKMIYVVLLMMIPFAVPAQDLSGFWKGSLTMNGCFSSNNMEIQIRMKGNEIWGDSYHYEDVDNYVKKKHRGRFDAATGVITIQEGAVVTWKIPGFCDICIKKFSLRYSRTDSVETLSGTWTGKIYEQAGNCGPGNILLTRVRNSAFSDIPEIGVDTGTLRLDFYDNAEIDGDSITVLVNRVTVLSNQRLSAKPSTLNLHVDAINNFHEVEMIAENEGSIPPNTALLIITAGEKRYRLFLSSTEVKSARVRFIYDPEAFNEKSD